MVGSVLHLVKIYNLFHFISPEESGIDERGYLAGLREHDTASTDRTQTDGK